MEISVNAFDTHEMLVVVKKKNNNTEEADFVKINVRVTCKTFGTGCNLNVFSE